jgi:hypothetical protein
MNVTPSEGPHPMTTKIYAWKRGMVKLKTEQKLPRLIHNGGTGIQKPRQISDFPLGSRSRLKQALLETKDLKTFLTITFHDSMFFGAKTIHDRLQRANIRFLAMRRFMEVAGYNGFFVRQIEVRKSSHYYQGQVLPHFHVYLSEALSENEIEDFKVCMVRAMQLPGAWYEKTALENAVHALGTSTKESQAPRIGYMAKPLNKQALKAFKGAKIGKSWGRIGQPEKDTPVELTLTPEQEIIFRRQVRRQVNAKIRDISERKMSKALKLHMTDKSSNFTAYLPFQDIKRNYQFSVKLAAEKIANFIDFQPTGSCFHIGAVGM